MMAYPVCRGFMCLLQEITWHSQAVLRMKHSTEKMTYNAIGYVPQKTAYKYFKM